MYTTNELDTLNETSHEIRIQLDTIKFHRKVDLMEFISIDTVIATILGASAQLKLDMPTERRAFGSLGDALIATEILEDVIDAKEGGMALQSSVANVIRPLEIALEEIRAASLSEFLRITDTTLVSQKDIT